MSGGPRRSHTNTTRIRADASEREMRASLCSLGCIINLFTFQDFDKRPSYKRIRPSVSLVSLITAGITEQVCIVWEMDLIFW